MRLHIELFKLAYGDDSIVPKHHYALHLWKMLAEFGFLISCLVLERLHKIPKRYVKERRNTKSYELGTIEDVTIKQLYDRREDWLATGCLLAPHEPPRQSPITQALRELYPDAVTLRVANRLDHSVVDRTFL